MDNVSFDAIGMDAIYERLEELGRMGDKAADAALKKAAMPILEEMTRLAPERPNDEPHWNLKSAIRTGKRRKRGGNASYLEVGVFNGEAPHAHLVEFGHGGPKPAPPHPFMRPAYEAKKAEARAILVEELRKELGLNEY